MQIVITKACYIAGVPQDVGKVLDVAHGLGAELLQNGKARKHIQADALTQPPAAAAASQPKQAARTSRAANP